MHSSIKFFYITVWPFGPHAAKYVLEMMLDDSELRWPSTEKKSFKMVP